MIIALVLLLAFAWLLLRASSNDRERMAESLSRRDEEMFATVVPLFGEEPVLYNEPAEGVIPTEDSGTPVPATRVVR